MLPLLEVAGQLHGGGFAAVVRCPFERWLSTIERCLCWKYQVNFMVGLQLSSGDLLKDDLRMLPVLEVSGQLYGGFAAVARCPFER